MSITIVKVCGNIDRSDIFKKREDNIPPYKRNIKYRTKPIGVGAFDGPKYNKKSFRYYGVSENSSLAKLIF